MLADMQIARDEAIRQLGQWQVDLERATGRATSKVAELLLEMGRIRPVCDAAVRLWESECWCDRGEHGEHDSTCDVSIAESALYAAVQSANARRPESAANVLTLDRVVERAIDAALGEVQRQCGGIPDRVMVEARGAGIAAGKP